MSSERLGVSENHEKLLVGKFALVTGIRDIGAEIAVALANEGVCVIGNYRSRARRAGEVEERIKGAGGKIVSVQADITIPSDRQKLQLALQESSGGKLDILILNASGPGRDINVLAANALIDDFLPRMNEGGTIVLMQSVPGHFEPQLRGLKVIPEFYNNVASAKNEGEQSIRKRISEMEQGKVSLIVVCPPLVPDTMNVANFTRKDRQFQERHNTVSDILGLPREVPKVQVGKKVVDLLKQSDLPSGYTEFFSRIEDSQAVLEKIYDADQVYVSTFIRRDDVDGKKRGEGRLIVSKDKSERTQDLPVIDSVVIDRENPSHAIGELDVTEAHMVGHFKDGSGLPKLFPGHKQIRAAIETAGVCIQNQSGSLQENKIPSNINLTTRLDGFDKVAFIKAVRPGEKLIVDVSMGAVVNNIHTANVEIRVGDEIKTIIENMRIFVDDKADKGVLLEDQLIEAMAQVAGINSDVFSKGEGLPLFQGIGATVFYDRVKAGEGVKMDVETIGLKRGFEGEVKVTSAGIEIARSQQIRATVLSLYIVKRILKS